MFEKEEKILQKHSKEYNDVPIPADLESDISKGIGRGRKTMRKNRLTKRIATVAACLLLVANVVAIRISPAYAQALSSIPGLEKLVKLINYDKGLVSALENDFMQHIGLSDEHEDITFTVDDIIVDEARMIVFYTIDNRSPYKRVALDGTKLLQEDGTHCVAAYGFSGCPEYEESKDHEIAHDIITVSFDDDISTIPDTITLKVKLRGNRDRDEEPQMPTPAGEAPAEPICLDVHFEDTWQIDIPIDKSKFEDMKEVYDLNQTIEIAGQEITFHEVTIHPTRIGVHLEYDADNSMKILGFDNLVLVDDNGDEWTPIINGICGSILDEHNYIMYFESNYFNQPDELYIKCDGIRALRRDQLNVVLDLDSEELLQAPDGLVFDRVEDLGNELGLVFTLDVENLERYHLFNFFSWRFMDATGEHNHGIANLPGMDDKNTIIVSIDKRQYASPLTFEIQDYPNNFKQEFEIKVK